jgi:hypothetical protein
MAANSAADDVEDQEQEEQTSDADEKIQLLTPGRHAFCRCGPWATATREGSAREV